MKNTNNHIDMKNKIIITVTNESPVSLIDLTDSLTGIADQYYDYIANDSKKMVKGTLYVSEIRKGSMVFELVAESLPYVSLLAAHTTPIEDWIKQFIATANWLKGVGKKPNRDILKKDLNDITKTFNLIANGERSNVMSFNLEGANIEHFNPIFYTGEDAKKISDRAKQEMTLLDEKDEHSYQNRLMIWDQTKFNLKANTGDKALIDSIHEKPIKIIFQNEGDKEYMYNAGKDFSGTPWQELGFIVDVEVQYLNGKPKVYNVIHVHKNETFILDDE